MRSFTTVTCRRLALVAAGAAAGACASAKPAPVPIVVTQPAPAMPEVVPMASVLRRGIVSLRVTGQDWNARAPWEKLPPWTRTVTGLVVHGKHILAASSAFGNHLLVEAQKL